MVIIIYYGFIRYLILYYALNYDIILYGGDNMDNEKKYKVSPERREYIERFEAENYDRVLIRFPKGTKDKIKATGESVNGFTVAAVLEKLAWMYGLGEEAEEAEETEE